MIDSLTPADIKALISYDSNAGLSSEDDFKPTELGALISLIIE